MAALTQTYPLISRNFDTIVSDQTAVLASSLSNNTAVFDTLDLTPGSPMLALLEANASFGLFVQYLAYKVLRTTRLATASGDDLDSFGADFLFARYPAIPTTGQVLFIRSTASTIVYVPINTVIKTKDGTLSFVVIPPTADPLNQYDPANGYIMLPNTYQVSVLVQCVTPGTIGNIPANTLTKVVSSTLPVKQVNNPSSFFNGKDASSDEQFKSAFALWIKSRDNATLAAYENAIRMTNPAYTYSILENYIAVGAPQPGAVLIYFDDGTGFPSTNRQIELQQAIQKVRAAGVTPFVSAAAPISLAIEMQVLFPTTAIRLANIQRIHDAIANYVNSLGVGENLLVTRLSQVIYNSCPALTEVYNISLTAIDRNGVLLANNGVGDVIVSQGQVLRFLPNPPIVNGAAAIQPSIIVID